MPASLSSAIADYLAAFNARSTLQNAYLQQLEQQLSTTIGNGSRGRVGGAEAASSTNGRNEIEQSIRAYSDYLEKEERTVLTPLERALVLNSNDPSALLDSLKTSQINHGTLLSELGKELMTMGEQLVAEALDWDTATFDISTSHTAVASSDRGAVDPVRRRNAPPAPSSAAAAVLPPPVLALNLPSPLQKAASNSASKPIKPANRKSGLFGLSFGKGKEAKKDKKNTSSSGSARYGESVLEEVDERSLSPPALGRQLSSTSSVSSRASIASTTHNNDRSGSAQRGGVRASEQLGAASTANDDLMSSPLPQGANSLQDPIKLSHSSPSTYEPLSAPPSLPPITLDSPTRNISTSSPQTIAALPDSSFPSPTPDPLPTLVPSLPAAIAQQDQQEQDDHALALALEVEERDEALAAGKRKAARREEVEREDALAAKEREIIRREGEAANREREASQRDQDKKKKKKKRESIMPGSSLFRRGTTKSSAASSSAYTAPNVSLSIVEDSPQRSAHSTLPPLDTTSINEFGQPLSIDDNDEHAVLESPRLPEKDSRISLPTPKKVELDEKPKKEKKRGFFSRALSGPGGSGGAIASAASSPSSTRANAGDTPAKGGKATIVLSSGGSRGDDSFDAEEVRDDGLVDAEGYSIKPVGYDQQPGIITSKSAARGGTLMDDSDDEGDSYGPPSPLPPLKLASAVSPALASPSYPNPTAANLSSNPPSTSSAPSPFLPPPLPMSSTESAEDRLAALERVKSALLASRSTSGPPSPSLGSSASSFASHYPTAAAIGAVSETGVSSVRRSTTRGNRRDMHKRETMLLAAAVAENQPMPNRETALPEDLPTISATSASAHVEGSSSLMDRSQELREDNPFAGEEAIRSVGQPSSPSAHTAISSSMPALPHAPDDPSSTVLPPAILSSIASPPPPVAFGLSRREIVNAIFRGGIDGIGMERLMIRGEIASEMIHTGMHHDPSAEWILRVSEPTGGSASKFVPDEEYLSALSASSSPTTATSGSSRFVTEYSIKPTFFAAAAKAPSSKLVLLRYQLTSSPTSMLVAPVLVKMGWKANVAEGWIGIVLRYSIAIKSKLKDLRFNIPVDSTITSVQSKPHDGKRLSENEYVVEGEVLGGEEEKKAMMRLLSTSEVAQDGRGLFDGPRSVGISFLMEGHCCSEMTVEVVKSLEGPREGQTEVKEECSSGRYLVFA